MITIENITYGPTPLEVKSGMSASFDFDVVSDDDDSLTGSVLVLNNSGNTVVTLSTTLPGPTNHFHFDWSGTDANNNLLPAGDYAPTFTAIGNKTKLVQVNFCTGVTIIKETKTETTSKTCDTCALIPGCAVSAQAPADPSAINAQNDGQQPDFPTLNLPDLGLPSLDLGAFGVPNPTAADPGVSNLTTGPNGNLAAALGVPNWTTGPNGNLAAGLGVPNWNTGPGGNLAAGLGIPNINVPIIGDPNGPSRGSTMSQPSPLPSNNIRECKCDQ